MSLSKSLTRLFIAFIFFTVFFFILAYYNETPFFNHVNHDIQEVIYDALGSYGLITFIIFTYLGSIYVTLTLTLILAIYFFIQKRSALAALLLFNFVSVRMVNQLLKDFYHVARPTLHHLVHVSNYSFPSGHAMSSIAFYGFVAFLFSIHLKKREKPTLPLWIVTCLFIFLIGLSRIYLGVHFPTDILGGYLAGLSTLIITLILYTFLIPSRISMHS